MKKRKDKAAQMFLTELFGKNYTEEECKIASKVIKGVAARFTSCAINFNMECPQFTPSVDSNYLLKLSNELLVEEDEQSEN